MSKTQSQLRDDLQGILAERGIHAAAMSDASANIQDTILNELTVEYLHAAVYLEDYIADGSFVKGYSIEDIREKPKRLYLAGPMRGLPDYNFPAFNEAAEKLRAQGYDVFNPADGHDPKREAPLPLKEYMKVDLPEVMESDAVVLLDNWWNSEGACLEVTVALACGIPVVRILDDAFGGLGYQVTLVDTSNWPASWDSESLESLEDLWK